MTEMGGGQLGRKHTPVTPALGSGWKDCELKASLSYTETLYQKIGRERKIKLHLEINETPL